LRQIDAASRILFLVIRAKRALVCAAQAGLVLSVIAFAGDANKEARAQACHEPNATSYFLSLIIVDLGSSLRMRSCYIDTCSRAGGRGGKRAT
jgi:hypothetical protein